MTQNKESGSEAAKWGLKAAALIGEKIGAKKLSPRANEFEFNSTRVTIRMAHLGNNQVGVLYSMLKRVETVIAAFEVAPNEFELRSLSSHAYKKHMRDSGTGKGRVGLVGKKSFLEFGKLLRAVTIRT